MVASDDVGANLSADAAAASLMSLARRPMVNVMSIMENSKRVERNQRQTKGRQAGKAKIVAGKTRASKPPAKGPPNRKDVGSASAQHAVDLGKRPEKSVEFEKPVEAEVIASAKQFSARQQRLMERRKRNAAVMGKKGNALKASNANSRQKADSVSARQTKGQQGEVAKAPQPQPESSGGDKGKKRKMFPPSAMCVDLEHRRATEVARAGSGEKSGAPPENVVDLTIDDDELDIEATSTAKAYNLGSLPRSLGSRLTKRARFVKSDGMIAQMVAKGPRDKKEVQISKLSTEKDLSRACSQMISRLAELHSHLFNGSLEQDCSVVGDQFPSFFVNEEYASDAGDIAIRSEHFILVQKEVDVKTFQTEQDGVPMWGSQLEQRFISELKVHVQKKFNLTHGLEDLGVDFILHEDKVLDSDVVGVQVHCQKKRWPWAALLLLANAIDCFSALHHEEGRRVENWQIQELKDELFL